MKWPRPRVFRLDDSGSVRVRINYRTQSSEMQAPSRALESKGRRHRGAGECHRQKLERSDHNINMNINPNMNIKAVHFSPVTKAPSLGGQSTLTSSRVMPRGPQVRQRHSIFVNVSQTGDLALRALRVVCNHGLDPGRFVYYPCAVAIDAYLRQWTSIYLFARNLSR